jgi:hypothetical protein
MTRQLNTYRLTERELAQAAVHRLNRDPYTLTFQEYKRAIYTLEHDHESNLLIIKAEYFILSELAQDEKTARNKLRDSQRQFKSRAMNRDQIRAKARERYHKKKNEALQIYGRKQHY